MNTTLTHRITAALLFCIAFFVYASTAQPSVPFWDCGEFTAAIVWQQVAHPPGAPLFIILGKVFSLIPIGSIAYTINVFSGFLTAITCMLVYLIGIKLINDISDEPIHYPAIIFSAIGTLCLLFSDSIWFNAVESEVYALSTMMVALILYLILLWREQADQPGNERYLLLIAYIIGLSIGVHLFSILTIFGITLFIYFKKYTVSLLSFIKVIGVSIVLFLIVYTGIVKTIPTFLAGNFFKLESGDYVISDSSFVTMIGVFAVLAPFLGIWYYSKKNNQQMKLIATVFACIIFGFSTYTHIVLRSSSHPPMNENDPETLQSLVSYINRDQYGDAPLWPRRYQTENSYVEMHKEYGNWTPPPTKQVTRNDGTNYTLPDYEAMEIHTSGEMKYLFSYQLYHMYIRYFLWNFMGRIGDAQDAGPSFVHNTQSKEYLAANYISGYEEYFPITFYALPLLIGFIGLIVHCKKNPQSAFSLLSLFVMLGILAAFAQNQQQPQPRERDYFYVGSFLVWSIWISIGGFSLYTFLRSRWSNILAYSISGMMLCVPLLMAKQGWFIHDRSHNYIAHDFAYNILQSCDSNAVLFTDGDNDTFPLWYIQDVEGIRRDVRIVNLTLAQMSWYLRQIKHEQPWGVESIPLTFSESSLNAPEQSALSPKPIYSEARTVTINVPSNIAKEYSMENQSSMRFTLQGMSAGKQDGKEYYYYGIQHQVVGDIVKAIAFKRPVYFSSTVSTSNYAGLNNYLRQEGLVMRVCPKEQQSTSGISFYQPIMDKSFLQYNNNAVCYPQQHYGFILRNMNYPCGYYDESSRNTIRYYRFAAMRYAEYLISIGQTTKAGKVLNRINTMISPEVFPMNYLFTLQVADLYRKAGYLKEMREYSAKAATLSDILIENPTLAELDPYTKNFNPYIAAAEGYQYSGNVDKAIDRLQTFLPQTNNDPYLQNKIDELQIFVYEDKKDYLRALQIAEQYLQSYADTSQQKMLPLVPRMEKKVNALRSTLGMAPIQSRTTILN